ncbi:MAG: hypothetical protein AB7R89_03245 [Dehalococcoidia bacterium]
MSIAKELLPSVLPISPVDGAVVRVVHYYNLVSIAQVCKLLSVFPGSLAYAQKRLKRLTDLGYLQAIYLPKTTQAGYLACATPGERSLPIQLIKRTDSWWRWGRIGLPSHPGSKSPIAPAFAVEIEADSTALDSIRRTKPARTPWSIAAPSDLLK